MSAPQLRCFIAVVSAGSVAEAARRLGMSAASVSKAVTRLEESAGVRLLHRSTHALSLTEEGEALLEPARAAVHAAQAFEDAASQVATGGDRGTVRVTAAVGLVRNVLAPLMGALAVQHPGIHLDVRATNEVLDLADGGIDVAVRSGSLAGLPGHLQQTWFSSPWVMCAAPSYLARQPEPTTIAELAAHELVGFRNQHTGRVAPWPHAAGRFELGPCLAFDDGDAVWAAMLAGAGIACAPLYLAAAALRSGAAREVLGAKRAAPVAISMVRRERRLTPSRVTAVMEFLIANAPTL